jgi:hypothetical protein
MHRQINGYKYVVTQGTGSRVATCESTGPDKINSLVLRLASTGASGWGHFEAPRLHLPAAANTEQLVAQLFKQEQFYKGERVEQYTIIESRVVSIPFGPGYLGDSFLGVLLGTNLGELVVLFQYADTATGWWRSYLY